MRKFDEMIELIDAQIPDPADWERQCAFFPVSSFAQMAHGLGVPLGGSATPGRRSPPAADAAVPRSPPRPGQKYQLRERYTDSPAEPYSEGSGRAGVASSSPRPRNAPVVTATSLPAE